MARVTLPFNGVAGSTLTTQYNVSLVGAGQILNDGDSGTYAAYTGGGCNVFSTLPVSPLVIPQSNYKMDFALKTTLAVSDQFNVYITQPGAGTLAKWQSFAQTCSVVDGWLRGAMILVEPVFLSQALNGATAPTAQIEMLGSAANVYEAKFIVTFGGEAPPCRLLGRGDDLGVGGGRNYPTAKSRQRSSRGVGYY